MIIAKAPLRISFAGGGTDIPEFYLKRGPGAVVATSIDKHVYVTLTEKFDGKISVRYRVHEIVGDASEIKHSLIRETLVEYGVRCGVEVVVISDVPARGSGLGASSALAVALCMALERFTGADRPMHSFKHYIAERASKIEIELCRSPIGKQDHYASAFGGLNLIKFSAEGVGLQNVCSEDFAREIESQSMLFYLNGGHEYAGGQFVQKILRDQVAEIGARWRTYDLQRDNALRLAEHMQYEVPERFIDHVNENWRLKKTLHMEISNPWIDEVIQTAYAAGATAAKVCGAGGGGFLYLVVPPAMQDSVRAKLSGLKELRFKFDKKGAEVIYDDSERSLAAVRG